MDKYLALINGKRVKYYKRQAVARLAAALGVSLSYIYVHRRYSRYTIHEVKEHGRLGLPWRDVSAPRRIATALAAHGVCQREVTFKG